MKSLLLISILLLSGCTQIEQVNPIPLVPQVDYGKICNSNTWIGHYNRWQIKDSMLTCYEVEYNGLIKSKAEFLQF